MATVIVFGPTGNVGSQAALAAHKHGAKVVLAMRDTSKSLPSPLAEQEKDGKYTRVKADLNEPDTVAAAVKSTGATRAYIYNVFGSPDFMKATLEALKSAGITFVLFLSTASIVGEPKTLPQDEIIPFVHRQVELNIEAVFGRENAALLRPGFFATNLLVWHPKAWPNGPVQLFNPEFVVDSITAEDMGDVSGAVLANGVKNGEFVIPLSGPEALSQRETIAKVGKGLGRPIEVQEINAEQNQQKLLQVLPAPLAEQLTTGIAPPRTGWEWLPDFKQGVANVELYAGRPGLRLEDWVANNKQLFV